MPHNVSMASRLIPLFPLHVVVFPRTPLPLHIFEERYKEMVGEAIRDGSEFGIVLAKDEGIVNAGCTVEVAEVLHRYPDGRLDILTRGKTRFEIIDINDDKNYLQGNVNFFDDDDLSVIPENLRLTAIELYRTLRQMSSTEGKGEPDLADPQLSFQLAQIVPDLDFLSVMLRQRSETGRLRRLTEFLREYIPRQRTIERVKAAAPTNGFGGKHAVN